MSELELMYFIDQLVITTMVDQVKLDSHGSNNSTPVVTKSPVFLKFRDDVGIK